MRRHRQAGFTLLEVLLVAMLMGLVATAVVLSMGGARGDRELDKQARRLMATLQQAQEYSVMDGRLLGLRVEESGWQFMSRNPKDRKWQALTGDKLLGPVQLPEGITLAVELEGFSWRTDSDEKSEQGRDEKERTPQIFIFPGGGDHPLRADPEPAGRGSELPAHPQGGRVRSPLSVARRRGRRVTGTSAGGEGVRSIAPAGGPARARGMTLLEVMVALAVFAIAGLAVMKTASEHLSGLNYLEQKTLATWVVENQLVQQKLEGKWPGDSWVGGDEEMAGQSWYWRYRGVATTDNNFKALDVEVRTAPKAESPVAMMRTYISR